MLLVEGRKLLDAQVFNGRQKLLKLSLQTFFFYGFLRILLPEIKKHTLFKKFLSQK